MDNIYKAFTKAKLPFTLGTIENRTISGNPNILFITIWNRTILGIVLSEFVLSGDPLYLELCSSQKSNLLERFQIKCKRPFFSSRDFSKYFEISTCAPKFIWTLPKVDINLKFGHGNENTPRDLATFKGQFISDGNFSVSKSPFSWRISALWS